MNEITGNYYDYVNIKHDIEKIDERFKEILLKKNMLESLLIIGEHFKFIDENVDKLNLKPEVMEGLKIMIKEMATDISCSYTCIKENTIDHFG
jgi:hypothetical protein